MVGMMGWRALPASFQGGYWAYAGRLLFTGTLTCRRKGLAGTSWSFNKGAWGVLHLWWSNLIQHWRLGTEWMESSFAEKDLGILGDKLNIGQQCDLVVEKATPYWAVLTDYSQQPKRRDYCLPFSIFETASETLGLICSPVKWKHWHTRPRPEEGCQNN